MPTSIRPNPIMKSVVTSDTAAHKLTDLLAAAFPTVHIPTSCAQLEIALDQDAPGDVYIGNDDVSSTNHARDLIPTQYWQSFARDSNDFPLNDVYVRAASASATRISVTILEK